MSKCKKNEFEPLTCLGILYSEAKIEASWIKERVITYAEEHEHNDRIKPYYEKCRDVIMASEIVKAKEVNIHWLKRACNVIQYNAWVKIESVKGFEELTEEEYDLLKKVYCKEKTTVYTENELRLKILNNPNIQLRFLKDSYPRSNYQITLMEDKIRVDFGYGEFKEDNNSLYLNLCDYGKTWTFMENKE